MVFHFIEQRLCARMGSFRIRHVLLGRFTSLEGVCQPGSRVAGRQWRRARQGLPPLRLLLVLQVHLLSDLLTAPPDALQNCLLLGILQQVPRYCRRACWLNAHLYVSFRGPGPSFENLVQDAHRPSTTAFMNVPVAGAVPLCATQIASVYQGSPRVS